MAMLVYRGFAIQDESRRYHPGPAMGAGPAHMNWMKQVRTLVQPHMELLATSPNESVNLMIRVGTKVRFVSTVEGSNVMRVGDRQGAVFPAYCASGGKAMLAELDPAVVVQLFSSPGADTAGDRIPDQDFTAFLSELATVRTNGFAVNFAETEEDVCALGFALHDGANAVVGAISVSAPAVRFRRFFDDGLLPVMLAAVYQLELDIAMHPLGND